MNATHTEEFKVTVTLANGQLYAEHKFDDLGNAAEYANSARELGYNAIVRPVTEDDKPNE